MNNSNAKSQSQQNNEAQQGKDPHSDKANLNHSSFEKVPTEEDFNTVKGDLIKFDREGLGILKERDRKYSDILNSYYLYVEKVLKENLFRQNVFFWISIAILILSPIQLIALIWNGNPGNLSLLLASAGEMLSAMIIFPKIIAEYLFNTNEVKNINDIVTTIQSYDLEIRKGIRHTVEGSTSNNNT